MMNLRKSVYIHVEIIAFMVGYFRSTVSQTDKSAPANISGNFNLKCPFTYNSTWERVYWKIKNQTIFTFNARTNATEKNGDEKRYKSSNHGSHLMITGIEKSDEGSYFCKVSTNDDRILIGGPFRLSVTDQERETFPTVPRITSPQATSPHFDKRWLIIPSVIVLVIIIIVIICFLKRKCSLCGIRQKPRRTSRQKPYAPVDGTADSEKPRETSRQKKPYAPVDGTADSEGDDTGRPEEGLHGSHASVNGNCSPGSSERNNQPLMLHVGQNRTTSRGLDPSPDPSHLDSSPLSFHSCRDFSVGDDASIDGDSSDKPGEDLNVSHAVGEDTGRPEEGLNGSHASVQGNNPPGNTDLSPISEDSAIDSAIDSGLGSSYLTTSSTPSSSNCPTYSQVLSPAESSNCSNLLESMLMDFSRPSGTSSTTSSFSWNYSKVVSPQGTTTTLMVSSHQGTPSSVPNPDSTQVSIPQGTISGYTVSSQQGTLTPSSVPNPDCSQTQQTKSKLSPVGPVLLDDLCHLYSVLSSEKIMQLKRDMRNELHLLVEECKRKGRSPELNQNLEAVKEYVKSGKRDFPKCVQEDVGYFVDELDLIPDGRKRDVFEVLLTMPENQQGYDKSKWCANKFLEPDQQDHQESTIGQETDSGSRRKQLIGEMVSQLTSSKTKSERDAARNNISRIILRALSGHTISGYSKPASMIEQEINTQSDYDQEIEDHNLISFWMSKVLKFKGTLQKNVLDQLRELDQDPQSACQDGAEKRSTKKDYMENVTGNKINRNTKQEDTEMAPKKEILNSYKPKNDFPTSEG